MSNLDITQIVGSPLADGWSQISFNQNQNLICAFGVKGEQAKNFGLEINDLIAQAQPASQIEFHHLLLDLIKKVRETNHQIQLAAVFLEPEQMTLATFDGDIWLKRVEPTSSSDTQTDKTTYKLGRLLSSGSELQLIAGGRQKKDALFLMTQAGSQLLTIKDNWLTQLNLDQQLDQLKQIIANQPDSCLCAVGVVQAQQLTPPPSTDSDLPIEDLEAESGPLNQPNPTTQPSSKRLASPSKSRIPTKTILTTIATILKASLLGLLRLIKSAPKLKNEAQNYLQRHSKRKLARIALTIIVVLFLASGIFFWYKINRQQITDQVNQDLNPAITLLGQAERLQQEDIFTAREKTTQAIELLTAQLKQYEQNRIGQTLTELQLERARQLYTQISGKTQLSNLDILTDLAQTEPNYLITQADANQNSLFFLDQGQQKLMRLELQSRQITTLQLPDEVKAKDFVSTADSIFILGQGIYQLRLADWRVSKQQQQSDVLSKDPSSDNTSPENFPSINQIKEQGDSTRQAILIDDFESYLYVLNPEKRNIYRFIDRNDQLSDPIGWLTNKQSLEFDQLNQLAINGFVWLADQSGQIYKYFQGEPEPLKLTGIPEELGDSLSIFTQAELEQLYILDPDNQRLVIMSEEGRFVKQIESAALAGATQVIVSSNQIFAVSGSIVYSLKE
ncbi:MAG: hypothetical protein GF381_03750 [Candidatus Pacebacteria bacterium]|nr:hypothetical protein [Candidatus Paceibacterota bacterium]